MPSACLSRAGLAANHKSTFKVDLAVAAGIPAKRPFDDATNKSVIKLLPRKPPAINVLSAGLLLSVVASYYDAIDLSKVTGHGDALPDPR